MDKQNQSGFIKTILLLIIALAVLKIVWGFDILDFLNRPGVREIWNVFVDFLRSVWDFIKKIFPF